MNVSAEVINGLRAQLPSGPAMGGADGACTGSAQDLRGLRRNGIEDPGGPIRQRIARSVDDITGRMPTPEEARELVLPPGVLVFRVLRTVYDADGRPLEVQDSVAAADLHEFRYEVDMR